MLEHQRARCNVSPPKGETADSGSIPDRPPERKMPVRNVIKPRILLVDDDETTVKAIARMLDAENFDCRMALDYRSAVRTAGEWLPDVVVCDIDLHSSRDGGDVLRAMRSAHRTIQGVSISGLPPAEAIPRSQAGGFAAHLPKPFDIEQLVGALRSLMATPRRGSVK